jgi:hypothetical protein
MDRAPNLRNFESSETRNSPEKERPAYDYKEIAREVLARIDQRLADLGSPQQPSKAWRSESGSRTDSEVETDDDVETVDDGMNPADRTALVRLALRGLVGLVLLASFVAAIAFLWPRRDAATETAAQPSSVLSSTASDEKAQPAAEPSATVSPRAVAEVSPAQAAPTQAPSPIPSRTAPDNDKPNAGPATPELAALMRKIDRDIAGLAQAVNELRLAQQQASQKTGEAVQQASDDSAKAADEIKAGVNQLGRAIVRAEQAEQTERTTTPKPAAAPSRSAAPAPKNRRYVPMYYSPRDAQAQFLR